MLHEPRLTCYDSAQVMSRATTCSDNAYHYPTFRITGKLCLTNTPSNTAFRGFGGPQGCMVAEALMDDIAQQLRLDPTQVGIGETISR